MSQVYEPYRRPEDLGAPPSESATMVRLTIDGKPVTAPEGTTVIRAAALAGINIPKLCASDMLEPFGSCRLCLVEIEGAKGLPASCTTEVADGMNVTTQNPRLADVRRNVMELYISDHPLDCLTCPTNGDCELQDMAGAVGLRDVRYGYAGENHLDAEKDESNPYFTFDPSKCIVCSRCVRACDEVQGTFALTIDGRGFDSKVAASQDQPFIDSECVSCGACVQACPTATLTETSLIEMGQPEHSVITTCAYCGVGCSFRAEMKGEEVVKMIPNKDGHANHGHSCVKGRFAFGYATHRDRITAPLIRESIGDPWREVSWEEAIGFAAGKLKRIREKYGANSIGGITSSRCTNEETYLVQKMVRAAFGNNNVDTCARVCHSPTGYGLKSTLGESAGTQAFDSVLKADVIMIIGANPTVAHPVFASQMKRRLREGARLIVIDPRQIDLVRSAHVEADCHLQLRPGANVAVINALAHVVLSEGLEDRPYIEDRCEPDSFEDWRRFILEERNSPEALAEVAGVPAEDIRAAARLYAAGPNSAIYYGLGVSEHAQGSTMVMGIANLAMATGNLGREGVGVSPLRGQNNVQGACDMGSFPHELPGYRHISDAGTRALFEREWGVELLPTPGFRIPNMFDAAVAGDFKGLYVQGEDMAQSDPDITHVSDALSSLECLIVQDLFLTETAKFAHVFLPGSSFLEKNGTYTNAERRISPVRKVMKPLCGYEDWEVTQVAGQRHGLPDELRPRRRDHGRDRAAHAHLQRRKLREARSPRFHSVAVQREGRAGHADHARGHLRARQGAVPPDALRGDAGTLDFEVPAVAHHRPGSEPVQRRRADTAHQKHAVARRGHPGDSPPRRRATRYRAGRLGGTEEPGRRYRIARGHHRAGAARSGLYDLPSSGIRRQRRDHGQFRLGDQLSGVQGHGRAGLQGHPAFRLAAAVRGFHRNAAGVPARGEDPRGRLNCSRFR